MWCSTKTDPNTMKHIGGSGFWGFCTNENCPTEEMRTEKTGTEATIASPLGMYFMCQSQFFLNFWHCHGSEAISTTMSKVEMSKTFLICKWEMFLTFDLKNFLAFG